MTTRKRVKSGFPPDDRQSFAPRREVGSRQAGDTLNQVYGLIPVLEALRSNHTILEQITIAEGVRHERLRE